MSPFVGSLAVDFGRIFAGEIGGHEGSEGYLRRIIIYLYGFCVPGRAGADLFIVRVFIGTAGVTGNGISDAEQALEDDLGMPEAAFGKVGHLFIRRRFAGFFDRNVDGL